MVVRFLISFIFYTTICSALDLSRAAFMTTAVPANDELKELHVRTATTLNSAQLNCDASTSMLRILKIMTNLLNKNIEHQAHSTYLLNMLANILNKTSKNNNFEEQHAINDVLEALENPQGPVLHHIKRSNRNTKQKLNPEITAPAEKLNEFAVKKPIVSKSICAEAMLKIMEIAYETYINLEKGLIACVPNFDMIPTNPTIDQLVYGDHVMSDITDGEIENAPQIEDLIKNINGYNNDPFTDLIYDNHYNDKEHNMPLDDDEKQWLHQYLINTDREHEIPHQFINKDETSNSNIKDPLYDNYHTETEHNIPLDDDAKHWLHQYLIEVINKDATLNSDVKNPIFENYYNDREHDMPHEFVNKDETSNSDIKDPLYYNYYNDKEHNMPLDDDENRWLLQYLLEGINKNATSNSDVENPLYDNYYNDREHYMPFDDDEKRWLHQYLIEVIDNDATSKNDVKDPIFENHYSDRDHNMPFDDDKKRWLYQYLIEVINKDATSNSDVKDPFYDNHYANGDNILPNNNFNQNSSESAIEDIKKDQTTNRYVEIPVHDYNNREDDTLINDSKNRWPDQDLIVDVNKERPSENCVFKIPPYDNFYNDMKDYKPLNDNINPQGGMTDYVVENNNYYNGREDLLVEKNKDRKLNYPVKNPPYVNLLNHKEDNAILENIINQRLPHDLIIDINGDVMSKDQFEIPQYDNYFSDNEYNDNINQWPVHDIIIDINRGGTLNIATETPSTDIDEYIFDVNSKYTILPNEKSYYSPLEDLTKVANEDKPLNRPKIPPQNNPVYVPYHNWQPIIAQDEPIADIIIQQNDYDYPLNDNNYKIPLNGDNLNYITTDKITYPYNSNNHEDYKTKKSSPIYYDKIYDNINKEMNLYFNPPEIEIFNNLNNKINKQQNYYNPYLTKDYMEYTQYPKRLIKELEGLSQEKQRIILNNMFNVNEGLTNDYNNNPINYVTDPKKVEIKNNDVIAGSDGQHDYPIYLSDPTGNQFDINKFLNLYSLDDLDTEMQMQQEDNTKEIEIVNEKYPKNENISITAILDVPENITDVNNIIDHENIVQVKDQFKIETQIVNLIREIILQIEPVIIEDSNNSDEYQSLLGKIVAIKQLTETNITHDIYQRILKLFENIRKSLKHISDNGKLISLTDLLSETSSDKFNIQSKDKFVEITYLVKKPKPLVVYPYYYIKYKLPANELLSKFDELFEENPDIINHPENLYTELLRKSQIVEVSPDLKTSNQQDLIKLIVGSGNLVKTELLKTSESANYENMSDNVNTVNTDVNKNKATTNNGNVEITVAITERTTEHKSLTEAEQYSFTETSDNAKRTTPAELINPKTTRITIDIQDGIAPKNTTLHIIENKMPDTTNPSLSTTAFPQAAEIKDLGNPFRKISPLKELYRATAEAHRNAQKEKKYSDYI